MNEDKQQTSTFMGATGMPVRRKPLWMKLVAAASIVSLAGIGAAMTTEPVNILIAFSGGWISHTMLFWE